MVITLCISLRNISEVQLKVYNWGFMIEMTRSAFKVRGPAVTSSPRQPPRHPLAAVTPSALSMLSAPPGAASTKSAGMCPRGCEGRLPSIIFRVQGIRVSGSRVAGVMGQDVGSRFRDEDLGLRSHPHCHRRRVDFLALHST